MEIKEAIEWLNGCIVSEEYKNGKPNGNITCDLTREVLNMAISALEKQIPELPKVAEGNDADGFWRPDMFFCPTCGKVIDTCEHHCICGQKIDWED